MLGKQNLIKAVQEKTNYSAKEIGKIIDATTEFITQQVAEGAMVNIKNFGTFSAVKRGERKGYNPRTGEPIIIEAHKAVHFKPGKAFKGAVNK